MFLFVYTIQKLPSLYFSYLQPLHLIQLKLTAEFTELDTGNDTGNLPGSYSYLIDRMQLNL